MLSITRTTFLSQSRAFSVSAYARAEKSFTETVKEKVEGVAKKFQNTGSIGSKFEKGGEVAEVGEKVGGPFSSEGSVGKQFSVKEGGAIGGLGQEAAKTAEGKARESKGR